MRKKPDIAPPENILPRTLDIIEQRRKYELITPLYGGGVTATEPDPVTVVRATEIRGQLRFWWRVMRGGQSEDDPPRQTMKMREDAIWGKAYEKRDKGISQEHTIQIVVDPDPSRRGRAIKPFEVQRGRPKSINGIPGYAAFPLQPDQKELQKPQPLIADLWEGVGFTLSISYPKHWSEEIEAALWAWETFGGLGARTRRGFGALRLLEIYRITDGVPHQVSYQAPSSRGVQSWIQNEARRHLKEGRISSDFPHISSNIQFVVMEPAYNNPMQAWSKLIKKLQDFRLYKNEDKRSAWPEADTIRAIAGQRTKNRPPGPRAFPRAAFGLPIIFHFTGDDAPENHTLNEADTHSQEPEGKERFASPLILRPLLCSDNRAVGLALLLEGSRVNLPRLILQDEDKTLHPVTGTLTPREARSLTQQLPVLQNETDVLQAFMKFLKGV